MPRRLISRTGAYACARRPTPHGGVVGVMIDPPSEKHPAGGVRIVFGRRLTPSLFQGRGRQLKNYIMSWVSLSKNRRQIATCLNVTLEVAIQLREVLDQALARAGVLEFVEIETPND